MTATPSLMLAVAIVVAMFPSAAVAQQSCGFCANRAPSVASCVRCVRTSSSRSEAEAREWCSRNQARCYSGPDCKGCASNSASAAACMQCNRASSGGRYSEAHMQWWCSTFQPMCHRRGGKN
jgi:hypothetical protein